MPGLLTITSEPNAPTSVKAGLGDTKLKGTQLPALQTELMQWQGPGLHRVTDPVSESRQYLSHCSSAVSVLSWLHRGNGSVL
jgi:hypothetical protein